MTSKSLSKRGSIQKKQIQKKKYALRVLARNYVSHDGVLYKRILNGIQLRCLKKDEADEVMREIHKGVLI